MTAEPTAKPIGLPIRFLIFCWLVVGSLDIVMAFIDFYVSTGQAPFVILRYIARGVFRKTAFSANGVMYLWGLLFHYFIALCFTLFFFLIYRSLHLVNRNALLVGILYGLFVFAMMNFIVLPVVFHKPWRFHGLVSIKAALTLTGAIGLPLSYLMRSYFVARFSVPSTAHDTAMVKMDQPLT